MGGLGQQTGHEDEIANGNEARRILKIICDVGKDECLEKLGLKATVFIDDMVKASNSYVTHWRVTGKQLFYLRDLKDKLL